MGRGGFHHHHTDFYLLAGLSSGSLHRVNEDTAVLTVELRCDILRLAVLVQGPVNAVTGFPAAEDLVANLPELRPAVIIAHPFCSHVCGLCHGVVTRAVPGITVVHC